VNIYLLLPDVTPCSNVYILRFTDFASPRAFVRALQYRAAHDLPIRLVAK
jgi:hypothetical protein